MNANMQQGRTRFCFQVYSRNRIVVLYVLANGARVLTSEIPSEAPLCLPSLQTFATVHFPVSKMLKHEAASETWLTVLRSGEPGLWGLRAVRNMLLRSFCFDCGRILKVAQSFFKLGLNLFFFC